MIVRLLPSEISRLILNYFEEENLLESYKTFLNECKYLEEFKLYLERGIGVPKTIHGKSLKDYLVIGSQTEDIARKNLDSKISPTTVMPNSSNQVFSQNLNLNTDRSVKRKLDTGMESISSSPLITSTNSLSSHVANNLNNACITRAAADPNLNDSDIIILDTSENLSNSAETLIFLNSTSPTDQQQCPNKKARCSISNQPNNSQIDNSKNSPPLKKRRVYNRITPTIRTIIENTSSSNTDPISIQNECINQPQPNNNQSSNSLGDILLLNPIMTKSVLGKQPNKS